MSVSSIPKVMLQTQVWLHPPSGQPHLHPLSVPVASHKANTEWAFTDLAKGSPVPWGPWVLHPDEAEGLQEMEKKCYHLPGHCSEKRVYSTPPRSQREAQHCSSTQHCCLAQPIPTGFLKERLPLRETSLFRWESSYLSDTWALKYHLLCGAFCIAKPSPKTGNHPLPLGSHCFRLWLPVAFICLFGHQVIEI